MIDVRRVVTLPLPELHPSTAGPAAHAPLAPRAPVPVHVLRDGRLTDTLACPAPLTYTHARTKKNNHAFMLYKSGLQRLQ